MEVLIMATVNIVEVDGQPYTFECEIADDIYEIKWNGSNGSISFTDSNRPHVEFTDYDFIKPYVDAHFIKKQIRYGFVLNESDEWVLSEEAIIAQDEDTAEQAEQVVRAEGQQATGMANKSIQELHAIIDAQFDAATTNAELKETIRQMFKKVVLFIRTNN
jgi:hypothetical protein